ARRRPAARDLARRRRRRGGAAPRTPPPRHHDAVRTRHRRRGRAASHYVTLRLYRQGRPKNPPGKPPLFPPLFTTTWGTTGGSAGPGGLTSRGGGMWLDGCDADDWHGPPAPPDVVARREPPRGCCVGPRRRMDGAGRPSDARRRCRRTRGALPHDRPPRRLVPR